MKRNCWRLDLYLLPVSSTKVLDTNVVLNQMDLLDNPSPVLSCVIVLQTVMQVRGFAVR